MKSIALFAASILVAVGLSGCLWPNLNSTLPTNGSYCISNVVISTPWGTESIGMITSMERQLTNQFTNNFLIKRADGLYQDRRELQ